MSDTPSISPLLRFNVSHSEGVALYAVTRGRETGLDIEFVRENFASLDIAKRFFSKAEVSVLGALPLERQTAADSTEGPDRPLGERGAVVADTVVTDSLTAVYLAKRNRRLADRLAARSGGAPTSARNWVPNRRRRKPDEQR